MAWRIGSGQIDKPIESHDDFVQHPALGGPAAHLPQLQAVR
jgi:hypothetical protein